MDDSNLRTYCLGIVAVTKPQGTDIIKVYPVERLTLEEGKIDEIKEDMKTTIVDIEGIPHTAEAKRTVMLEARWFADGADGRQTPPDVVDGETVRIYRYSNSEVFYWKTMFREPNLRRLEHVVHAYSNLKEGRESFDLDSSYGSVFSTKDKVIRFWTSNSDGETFKYELVMDARSGAVRLQDNVGNSVGINSGDSEVFIKNADGSDVTVQGSTISLNAKTIVSSGPIKAPAFIVG